MRHGYYLKRRHCAYSSIKELEHLQSRPQGGLPRRFFRAGAEKTAQSRPQEPDFRRLGPKTASADPGRTRRAGGARGRRGELFWRETAVGPPRQRHGASSSPNGLGSRGESMPRLPPVSLAIDSSRAARSRDGAPTPPLPRTRTHGRGPAIKAGGLHSCYGAARRRAREGRPGAFLPTAGQEERDFLLNSCLIRLIHLLSLHREVYLTPKQGLLDP